MRAVIQRVSQASLKVKDKEIASIAHGIFILLGVGNGDNDKDIVWLANKIINLRIFEDAEEKFNRSLSDVKGDILLVSQFTLFADCKRGRRPSFDDAMPPAEAENLIKNFALYLRSQNVTVKEGIFGARMEINLTNYGPVTIFLDSKEK